ALLHAIGEMLPKDAVVIEEALSSAPGIRQLIRSDDPQSYFGLRGGGIGWGLPATIGVKLALPDRPVLGLLGDGSALYTCQGLWTAARYRIGAVFVILNNSSYRILKQRLHGMRGLAEQADSYVGMELVDPRIDFVSLARSLGVAAERAKTVHETTDLIARAFKNGEPMLIDVELDRAFKPMSSFSSPAGINPPAGRVSPPVGARRAAGAFDFCFEEMSYAQPVASRLRGFPRHGGCARPQRAARGLARLRAEDA